MRLIGNHRIAAVLALCLVFGVAVYCAGKGAPFRRGLMPRDSSLGGNYLAMEDSYGLSSRRPLSAKYSDGGGHQPGLDSVYSVAVSVYHATTREAMKGVSMGLRGPLGLVAQGETDGRGVAALNWDQSASEPVELFVKDDKYIGGVRSIRGQDGVVISVVVFVKERGGRVFGHVLDAQSGLGVAAACITIDGRSAMTDELGYYAIDAPGGAGQFVISVYCRGYAAQSLQFSGNRELSRELNWSLLPGYRCDGVVLSQDGNPIPGATISCKQVEGGEWVTRVDGRFTIDGIASALERVDIDVGAVGFISRRMTVRLNAGAASGVTIKLMPALEAIVSVSSEEGRPIAGARVAVVGEDFGQVSVLTDSTGLACVRVGRQAQEVIVSKDGYCPESILLDPSDASVARGVVMQRSSVLAIGVCVDPNGLPVAGVSIFLEPGSPRGGLTYCVSRADGTFRLLGDATFVGEVELMHPDYEARRVFRRELQGIVRLDPRWSIRGRVSGLSGLSCDAYRVRIAHGLCLGMSVDYERAGVWYAASEGFSIAIPSACRITPVGLEIWVPGFGFAYVSDVLPSPPTGNHDILVDVSSVESLELTVLERGSGKPIAGASIFPIYKGRDLESSRRGQLGDGCITTDALGVARIAASKGVSLVGISAKEYVGVQCSLDELRRGTQGRIIELSPQKSVRGRVHNAECGMRWSRVISYAGADGKARTGHIDDGGYFTLPGDVATPRRIEVYGDGLFAHCIFSGPFTTWPEGLDLYCCGGDAWIEIDLRPDGQAGNYEVDIVRTDGSVSWRRMSIRPRKHSGIVAFKVQAGTYQCRKRVGGTPEVLATVPLQVEAGSRERVSL